ncbi:MAG TPA: tripartite tricarboxylate transporter substrate binding protein [Pseudolabrys sp.]|jgi:tripartite-type tricarboxylate transporter receptor subunit TctC
MATRNPAGLTRRSALILSAGVAASALSGGVLLAADYPQKPIRFVVPFTPGGGADALARIAGQVASKQLGQQIFIDNRPGAGGNISAEMVAKASADGYTLLEGNLAHAIAMTLYRNVRYDIEKDFTPVIALGSVPFVLAVSPSVPVKSVQDFLALARAKPGALNYASSGVGGPSHLAMELLASLTGVKLTHIPYKGAAPAAEDLMAGRVQASFLTTPASVALMQSGRIRGIALSAAHRLETLPDLPTIAESGVAEYEATTWFGVMAPRGTPDHIVQTLNKAFSAAVQDSGVRKRLQTEGFEMMGGRPQDFAAFIRAQTVKWGAIVKQAGIAID